MVRRVAVVRDTHTVAVQGKDVVHLDFMVDADQYGEPFLQTPVSDDLLESMGPPYSISWSFTMERTPPFTDDPFDMSMPGAIANAGFRAEEDGVGSPSTPEEVRRIDMYHLHVQEAARQMGYGQLLWDAYLAVVAYGGYRASGGVGSTEDGATVEFLRDQGVPMEDISPGTRSPQEGSGLVRWDTQASNLADAAPITVQEVPADE